MAERNNVTSRSYLYLLVIDFRTKPILIAARSHGTSFLSLVDIDARHAVDLFVICTALTHPTSGPIRPRSPDEGSLPP